ncbi:unnamed protein product [Tilletia controversa]|nr:unnamed protein product [Tilletia controversa]CAD6938973.1 unnamed protein product [Tilletia controversa]
MINDYPRPKPTITFIVAFNSQASARLTMVRAHQIQEAEETVAVCLLEELETDPEEEDVPSLLFISQAMLCDLYTPRYLHQRAPIPKSRDWVDTIFPDLDAARFKTWVRMDRASFAFIHDLIAESPVFGSTPRSPQAPVAEQLAIALHKFGTHGTGSGIRMEAGHWGQSEGHIVNSTRRVAHALCDILQHWIKWPGEQERAEESRNAAQRAGLEGMIGKVDGTDVVLHERPGERHP